MGEMEKYIRNFEKQDMDFLWDMLYESMYVEEGKPALSRDILKEPAIEKYLKDWGRDTDRALISVNESNQPLGAIWIRLFSKEDGGYGFIDEETPELGIALIPEARGKGIGKKLMREMFQLAKSSGYKALSLSVNPQNVPALNMYEMNGFIKIGADDGGSWVMKKEL
ncbi:GNAT family N-acetyltransferase [Bacillus shackletonii]|nr:GNAT family N-acetyltransferase [Heyndrickxia shackletonii]